MSSPLKPYPNRTSYDNSEPVWAAGEKTPVMSIHPMSLIDDTKMLLSIKSREFKGGMRKQIQGSKRIS